MQGTAIAVLGTEPVRIHFENMQTHTSAAELSSRRIGLAMALPFRGEVMPKNITNAMRDTVEQQRPLKMVLAGLFLLLLAWAIRKSDDDEAFAVGFLPFFMLTTASYYYYVTRITLTILHAANLEKARHVYGLVFLFGLEAFSNWAEVRYPEHRVFLIGFLSWGIVAYALSMTAWIGWESMRPATPTKAAP